MVLFKIRQDSGRTTQKWHRALEKCLFLLKPFTATPFLQKPQKRKGSSKKDMYVALFFRAHAFNWGWAQINRYRVRLIRKSFNQKSIIFKKWNKINAFSEFAVTKRFPSVNYLFYSGCGHFFAKLILVENMFLLV